MAHIFQPKGFTIWRRKTKLRDIDGSPAYRLFGHYKSRGRTGAATRSLFTRLSDYRQQQVLAEWVMGHAYIGPLT